MGGDVTWKLKSLVRKKKLATFSILATAAAKITNDLKFQITIVGAGEKVPTKKKFQTRKAKNRKTEANSSQHF